MGTIGAGRPWDPWQVPQRSNGLARAAECRGNLHRRRLPEHNTRRMLANLSTAASVGTIANMKAELITRFKSVAEDGGVMELVVWRVPRPVPPRDHGYKYRAVYAVDGVRVVGFDDERGKGDHCHLRGQELPYTFTTVDALVEDFIAAVDAASRTP